MFAAVSLFCEIAKFCDPTRLTSRKYLLLIVVALQSAGDVELIAKSILLFKWEHYY